MDFLQRDDIRIDSIEHIDHELVGRWSRIANPINEAAVTELGADIVGGHAQLGGDQRSGEHAEEDRKGFQHGWTDRPECSRGRIPISQDPGKRAAAPL